MKITASTLLINLVTEEYPVFLYKIRQDNPNVSFAAEPEIDIIRDLGYDVVTPTASPSGGIVTEDKPLKLDSGWVQQWVIRPYTDDELVSILNSKKEEMSRAVDALRAAKLAEGFRFDFGNAGGVQGVQLRDDDKTNIIGLRVTAESLKTVAPDALISFRTTENNVLRLPTDVVIAMSNAAFQRVQSVYGVAWELKDRISMAKTLSELPVLPHTLEV